MRELGLIPNASAGEEEVRNTYTNTSSSTRTESSRFRKNASNHRATTGGRLNKKKKQKRDSGGQKSKKRETAEISVSVSTNKSEELQPASHKIAGVLSKECVYVHVCEMNSGTSDNKAEKLLN